MNVFVTCKNEEDPIKIEGARVFTTLYINFSDAQGQITPASVVVSGRNLNSSKLSCMFSLSTRMKMIQSKNKGARVVTTFLPHNKSMEIFPDAQGQLTPWSDLANFKLLLDVMDVLVKEDLSKNESARVVTRYSPL